MQPTCIQQTREIEYIVPIISFESRVFKNCSSSFNREKPFTEFIEQEKGQIRISCTKAPSRRRSKRGNVSFLLFFFFLFATSYEFMRERKKHRIGWMVQNLGHPLITLLLGNLANKGEGSFSTAFRSCLEKLAHTIIAKNDNESSFPPRFSPQFFPPRRAALIDRLAAVCPS